MQRHLKALHRVVLQFGSTVRKLADYGIDLATDAILGISTFSPVPADPAAAALARNIRYDPLPYRSLYGIARRLRVSRSDSLLDLGCGKGRVLCFFALRGLRKCSGIEISPELADQALINARRLRLRRSPIEITEGDAVDVDVGEASIIYLFNPFSAEVMAPVLRRIEASMSVRPRRLRICYVNPAQSRLLDACAWLARTDEFVVTWSGWHSCPVKVWSVPVGPSPRSFIAADGLSIPKI
jgi:SAM-dependent methyltransferase